MDATAATAVAVPLGELLPIIAEMERNGRIDEAARLLGHARAAAAEHPDVLHLSGIVAFRQKRPAEALALMERAIATGGEQPLYLRNICELYRTQGRLEEARRAAERALALAPNDAMVLHNLAVIHYERTDVAASIDCAERALAIDDKLPGAHFQLAEAHLLLGDWAKGWEEYEWRYRITGVPPLMPPSDKPQWSGAKLRKQTLLLIADQGFGDVIQFARYIPWARERCPSIAIACSAEVAPLLRQIAPDAPIFQNWNDCPPWAVFCPLSGLPRLHRTRIDTVPAPVPYLQADPARVEKWRARLDRLVPPGFRRIAIAWAGRPTHNNDRNRSTRLATFAPLAQLGGTALLSLQKGEAVAQVGGLFGRAPLVNLGAEIEDYDDTMAILTQTDLLVSVDTSVVHLAGAMGRPVWVMLPRAPDWRWLRDREDTPWYPTMRLLRQDDRRDFRPLVERVAAELSSKKESSFF